MGFFADPDYDPTAELAAQAPELREGGISLRGPGPDDGTGAFYDTLRAANDGDTRQPVEQPSTFMNALEMFGPPQIQGVLKYRAAQKKADTEKVRERLIGEQTQAITGLLNAAMLSGPEMASSIVGGISKFKGLEPETVQNVHKEMIKAGLTVREAKAKSEADDQALEAIAKLDPNTRDFANAAIKASGGSLGAAGFLGLLKAGVFGQPRERFNTGQGLAEASPTGPLAAAQGYTGPNGVTMLTGAKTEAPKPPTTNEMALFVATNGRTSVMNNTITPTEAANALNLVKSPELTPETMRQRESLIRAGVETRTIVTEAMKAQNALINLNQATALVDSLSAMSEQLFTARTEWDAAKQGAWYTSRSYIPGAGQDYKRYVTTVKGYAVTLGKAEFDHVGVQTEKDAERTESVLLDPYATKATTRFNLGMVRDLMKLKEYQLTEIASGRRVDMVDIRKRSTELTNRLVLGAQRMKDMPAGYDFVPGSVNEVYEIANPQNRRTWKDKK